MRKIKAAAVWTDEYGNRAILLPFRQDAALLSLFKRRGVQPGPGGTTLFALTEPQLAEAIMQTLTEGDEANPYRRAILQRLAGRRMWEDAERVHDQVRAMAAAQAEGADVVALLPDA